MFLLSNNIKRIYAYIDGFKDKYDIACLISGDSDLVPVLSAIKKNFQNKEILVFFPPNRKTKELTKYTDYSEMIFRKSLKISQLPEQLKNKYGYTINRPSEWRGE